MRASRCISKHVRNLASVLLAAALISSTCLGACPSHFASAAESHGTLAASTKTASDNRGADTFTPDANEPSLGEGNPDQQPDANVEGGITDGQENAEIDAPGNPDAQPLETPQAEQPGTDDTAAPQAAGNAATAAADASSGFADPAGTGTGTYEFANVLTGLMADLTRSVDYQVVTKLPDGAADGDIPAKVVAADGSERTLNLPSSTVEPAPVPVSLKNGERLVIENVPLGTEVTVTQAGLVGYATTVAADASNPANAADPTSGTSLTPTSGVSSPSGAAAPFIAGGHMLATDPAVSTAAFTFTHERGEVSATGIDEGSAALALVPVFAAASLGLLFAGTLVRRRMRRWR